MRPSYALLLVLLSSAAFADNGDFEFGGHSKFRLVGQSFPDDSLFHDVAGDTALDAVGELRLNVQAKHHGWMFKADYQLVGILSEFLPAGLPSDDRRLFDLTDIVDQSGDQAVAHRLDRLWVGYTGEKTVVRFGRQALSWGNGLFFAPLDLVNPFDPTAIDTEYKSGDDMLYTQFLRDNGDDVQAAVVFRRDLGGDVESDEATIAAKYHGFAGEYEYDILVAENYGDTVVGVGAVRSIGGAVWRADVVATDLADGVVVEVVTNLSYSWIWGGRNTSGTIEYFYDGFDRHYVAASVLIEMSPLWALTPTLVANADDPSALLQVVTSYSLSDNMSFLGSLNVPLGASGTEFGGPEFCVPPSEDCNRYLSFDAGVFAQLAWYF